MWICYWMISFIIRGVSVWCDVDVDVDVDDKIT